MDKTSRVYKTSSGMSSMLSNIWYLKPRMLAIDFNALILHKSTFAALSM